MYVVLILIKYRPRLPVTMRLCHNCKSQVNSLSTPHSKCLFEKSPLWILNEFFSRMYILLPTYTYSVANTNIHTQSICNMYSIRLNYMHTVHVRLNNTIWTIVNVPCLLYGNIVKWISYLNEMTFGDSFLILFTAGKREMYILQTLNVLRRIIRLVDLYQFSFSIFDNNKYIND